MYRIGIDLGGTNIALGIVTEDGKLLKKVSTPTNAQRSAEEIAVNMVEATLALIESENISREEIISIGIGVPGAVDDANGICVLTANLPFKNFNIAEVFKRYTDIPVRLANDANCAALGEAISGAAQGCNSALVVTLGTGVGGGVIIDSKIYAGFNYAGGELGHMVTHRGGRQCNCGRKGCFETYASATALVRDTKEAAVKNPDSYLYKICGGDTEKLNGKSAFDGKEAGDKVSAEVVENYMDELAVGIINYINIFQPEILLLGGGVANQKENLLKPLREKVYKEIYGADFLPRTKIDCTVLGNDAGIIGAAML
ncbi:MAG: ROK family protein [Clostridia bacterium]|nr:ROK family protein [Clostridia bacterium]